MNHRFIRAAVVAGVAAAVAAIYGVYRLLQVPQLAPAPAIKPARTFEDAVARAHALQARDDNAVQPVCATKLYSHGGVTPRAFVLLHGFTNCPQQFVRVAEDLYAAGHNVIVPRYPYHGLDPMATDIRLLTAEQLAATAAEAVDIACGLGEDVTVVGLSLGGVLTTWLSMHHSHVDEAIVIAPALGTVAVTPRRTPVTIGALRTLPNFFRWWDSRLKEAVPGPGHVYPRLASRAFAQLLRLSHIVVREASARLPSAAKVTLILNPADDQVDNNVARAVFAHWRSSGAAVTIYEFSAELALPHDLIDPAQPMQQVDTVNPVLYDVIAGRTSPLLALA